MRERPEEIPPLAQLRGYHTRDQLHSFFLLLIFPKIFFQWLKEYNP